jgi:hypothetical protein
MDKHAYANKKAKGKRPWFYESKEAERVLNIALAIAQELAVTRERLDTLERLLEAKGILAQPEFDSYVPNNRAADQRAASTQDYLARIFRVLSQEIEAASETGDKPVTIEELATS